MSNTLSLQTSLNSRLWGDATHPLLRNIVLLIAGSLLLTVASKIVIPLSPVPITLQTLAVFFIATTYGWRLGSLTIIFYLAQGALGLPVFAEPTMGPAALLGPTAGYLFAFVPAAAIAGYLVEKGWGRNFLGVLLAQVIASIVIFGGGMTVLALYIGWQKSIILGLLPFLLGDSLKMIFLAFIVPTLWKTRSLGC